MNFDFVIKNPLWARVAGWVITAIGFIAIAVVSALYFTVSMDYMLFVSLEVIGAVFAGIGLLIGYVGIMEKFELKGGVFFYRKPFKKKQSATAEDVDRVEVRNFNMSVYLRFVDVVFYDKDGKKLIHFYDDGTAFRDGKFVNALQELYIPIFYC